MADRERRPAIAVDIAVAASTAHVRWSDRDGEHHVGLDRLADSEPRWVAAAEDVEASSDRRAEATVIDALVEFGRERGESVGLYHADGRIELLTTH